MKNWYLIQTKPNQENKAILNLENQNYEVYQPKMLLRKKRKGQWQSVSESLFPLYLFIYLDSKKDNWTRINSTLGVNRFVRFGSNNLPSKVNSEIIDVIKEQEKKLNQETEVGEQFKKGDKVVLSNENFIDVKAIFQEKSKENRVFVFLNLLGKNHKIEINENDITKT
jgi:transcriptional antiterminator RfaH